MVFLTAQQAKKASARMNHDSPNPPPEGLDRSVEKLRVHTELLAALWKSKIITLSMGIQKQNWQKELSDPWNN